MTPDEEILAIETVLRLHGWRPTGALAPPYATHYRVLPVLWTNGTRWWAPPNRLDQALAVIERYREKEELTGGPPV
jgi:hypothetical protein